MVRVAGEASGTARYVAVSPPGTDDAVVLCYESAGEGTPVVCLPDLGDTNRVWRKVVPALSSVHRVLAVEPRGHGRSSNPGGKYTLTQMAEDVATLLARVGVHRPILLGHGLGARIALLLAVERSRLPAALVLIAGSPAPAPKSVRRGVAERIHLAEAGSMHEAYKNRKSEGCEPRGMTPTERAERHRLFTRNDPGGYASAGYAELLAPDLSERLGEVACPVLALAGEHDPAYHEGARALAEGVRACTSVLVEGAGRYVQLDRPEAALALAHDFFRKHQLLVATAEKNDDPTD